MVTMVLVLEVMVTIVLVMAIMFETVVLRLVILFQIVLVVTVTMMVTSRNLRKPADNHSPFYLVWWES